MRIRPTIPNRHLEVTSAFQEDFDVRCFVKKVKRTRKRIIEVRENELLIEGYCSRVWFLWSEWNEEILNRFKVVKTFFETEGVYSWELEDNRVSFGYFWALRVCSEIARSYDLIRAINYASRTADNTSFAENIVFDLLLHSCDSLAFLLNTFFENQESYGSNYQILTDSLPELI